MPSSSSRTPVPAKPEGEFAHGRGQVLWNRPRSQLNTWSKGKIEESSRRANRIAILGRAAIRAAQITEGRNHYAHTDHQH